ncbi:Sushi, von Willebrand factor type A, EGF and pentraxin [Desmophyllum pertusum]|uniref:Sushi, von Willebrand factor type A, EGF and pentraxin n=1 Tax=Desmophyllum pertusum TaxID=174260 RepID=A0A9X0CY18_9CNID|nr:Sushi, von Willebrand factor type A, EGF and pentraxin [Desmophyllum pertusum]
MEVIYQPVWSYCSSDSCSPSHRCQTGFTEKGYRCVAKDSAGENDNTTECPSSWNPFEGSCYKLYTEGKDWITSKAFCENNDAQLVKIESAEENDFIKSQYLTGNVVYWIGLTDAENEGTWKWSDGSALTGYINWHFNEPNDMGGEDCVQIVLGTHSKIYNAGWNDATCSISLGFICEK